MKIIANLIKVGNVLEHKGKKFHVLNTIFPDTDILFSSLV